MEADGHLVTDMDAIALRMPPEFINAEMCRNEIGEIAANDDLPLEAKAAILHGNAERFFGLSERMAKRSV